MLTFVISPLLVLLSRFRSLLFQVTLPKSLLIFVLLKKKKKRIFAQLICLCNVYIISSSFIEFCSFPLFSLISTSFSSSWVFWDIRAWGFLRVGMWVLLSPRHQSCALFLPTLSSDPCILCFSCFSVALVRLIEAVSYYIARIP